MRGHEGMPRAEAGSWWGHAGGAAAAGTQRGEVILGGGCGAHTWFGPWTFGASWLLGLKSRPMSATRRVRVRGDLSSSVHMSV